MEPAPPPAPQPAPGEVVVRGSHRPLTALVVVLIVGPLFLLIWFGLEASPLFVGIAGAALALMLGVLLRFGIINLGWYPAELAMPPGPLLLGSRTELTYRRRPRRPRPTASGRLHVALVCEERVVVGSGDNRSTRTATAVRHLIEAPLTLTPAGVEARFTIEIPLVAGAPTLRVGADKSVVWRIETTLDGDDLPGEEMRFPLEVAPVITPAWFDQRAPR